MTTELAILTALNRVVGVSTHYPLPELTVQADVNLIVAEPVTLTALRGALNSLEGKRQVVSVPHEDKGTMWKITAAGRARLAE